MIYANTAYDPADTGFWRAHSVVLDCTMIELARYRLTAASEFSSPRSRWKRRRLLGRGLRPRPERARTSAGDVGTILATHLLMLDAPRQALELSPLMIALVI